MSGITSGGTGTPTASGSADQVFALLSLVRNEDAYSQRIAELQKAEQDADAAQAAATQSRADAAAIVAESNAKLAEIADKQAALDKAWADFRDQQQQAQTQHEQEPRPGEDPGGDLDAGGPDAGAVRHPVHCYRSARAPSSELNMREAAVKAREESVTQREKDVAAKQIVVDAQMAKIKEIAAVG